MKNRLELAEHFRDLGFKYGAEIGVFNGHYSDVLLKTIPGLYLWGIDPFKVYHGYRDHAFQKSMDKAKALAQEVYKPYKNATLVEKMSTEAVRGFRQETLDFVYIDGNHEYPYVKEDIELWTPIVRRGGIVAGHDYYVTKTGNVGIIRAVNDYVAQYNYVLELTDWDATQPLEDDRQPSWWFIK
jgi:hypothetical protein